MNVADVQEWQKVQEDFEKNWTDGTFPGWPVNVVFDIMITVFLPQFLERSLSLYPGYCNNAVNRKCL